MMDLARVDAVFYLVRGPGGDGPPEISIRPPEK